MAYFRTGAIGKGEQVGFAENMANTVWSDRKKPLHVVYETSDKKKLDAVRTVLGDGFESKELDSYTVVFLTELEAQVLIQQKLAYSKRGV